MTLGKLTKKLCPKVRNLFVKPIRVFCFHQVSEIYNPLTMWKCDWTQLDQFKENILRLNNKYVFISLQEACEKLKHKRFRFRKYAVLTADDGYKSILNVLPWLEEKKIPIALFINTKYLDKHSWCTINEEQAVRTKSDVDMLSEVCPDLFMSKEELFALDSHLISVGLHGHEHLDATKQSEDEFRENLEKCRSILSSHKGFVPFHAYTWGHHNAKTDRVVREMGFIPVLVNGMNNYNKTDYIDRICIDGKTI